MKRKTPRILIGLAVISGVIAVLPQFLDIAGFILIMAFLLLLIWFMGFLRRCKACKTWGALKYDGRKPLGSWQEIATLKETQQTQTGSSSSHTSIERQVPVTVTEFMYYYHCRYCGTKTQKKKVKRPNEF